MTRRERLFPLIQPLMRIWWRRSRAMTLGVRVLATDADGRIALVRHTYMPGWFLPGGGVERGERAADAARKELAEETGAAAGELTLLGVYANFESFPGDHVLLFRADNVAAGPRPPDLEIAEAGWFEADALPDGATAATRRRIDEALRGAPANPDW